MGTQRETPPPTTAAVSKAMRGTGAESRVEKALRSELHARGMRFRKHVRPLDGVRCRPDVVFSRQKLAVFVDGCFWHGCPEHCRRPVSNASWWHEKLEANIARDRLHDAALGEAGWRIVRLWEHESLEAMADQIAKVHNEICRCATPGAVTRGGRSRGVQASRTGATDRFR